MRLTILLSLALMVAPVAQAAAAMSGTWSNVRVNDTNGETRGMRVEVREGATVFVTDCEVQCGAPVRAEARIEGKSIAFSVNLGRGAVTRFAGEFRDDGALVLKVAGRPWNALILRPEKQEVSREDTPPPLASPAAPCAGRDCIPASLTHLPTAWGGEGAVIQVASKENASNRRFAGVWSSITYVNETDDFVGMRVDVRPGAAPVAIVTDCGGGCSEEMIVPVTLSDAKIAFTLHAGQPYAVGYTGKLRPDGALLLAVDGNPDAIRVLQPEVKE